MAGLMRSFILINMLLFSSLLQAEGIEFFEGDFEEAFAMANTSGKLVFVDAYAQWCGPCKRMAATTFKDSKVGEFFNETFINMKIDMEKGQGLRFRKKYPVSAYPTLMFINGEGEIVHKATGGKDVDGIIQLAKLAMRKDDRSDSFAKKYEAGDRDYDLVLNYITALNKVGKPSLKISNEYLRSNPDITEEQKAAFLFEAATDADSRLFDQMLGYKSKLEKIKGKEIVIAQIEKACCKTVEKAVEYENEDLLKRAKEKMKKNAKSAYKAFDIKSDMDYFEGIGKVDKYLDKTEEYTKKIIKDNADELLEQGKHLAKNYQSNPKAVALVKTSYERSLALNDSPDGRVDYASTLHKLKDTDLAINQAKLAKQMIEKKGDNPAKVDRLIKFLESTR
jgi:thiol-disulfide isomerase/thioredoxin